ncbi:MAG: acyltransferase family protein [Chlorobiaceae bacterium]|nr:acyltransferase family protein [Chlorobiaceae bacterium]
MSVVKYRPEIDGLRALAIISVVIFHTNKTLLPGGFIGVDVFFVISGFLITSIILKEYNACNFKLTSFWSRRIKRIAPALIVMVFAVFVIGRMTLYGQDINILGEHGIATLLSYANISHWRSTGNYWGETAENAPLLHTWSLSVEEQFYLFFPWISILLIKFYNQWLLRIFIVFTLISYLIFLYGTQINPSATFYLLPSRAWELGAGSICSIIILKKHSVYKNNQILALAGLLSIVLSFIFLGADEGITPLIIIPIIGTSLIILFANNSNNFVTQVLSLPPIVYIGKISYSLYLWHWPVMVFSRQLSAKHNQEQHIITVLTIILIISILSYHFIEMPSRKNKKIIYLVIPSIVICLAISIYMKVSNFSENLSYYNKTVWLGELYNVNPNKKTQRSTKKRMDGIVIPKRPVVNYNAYRSEGIVKIYGEMKMPEIMVLGDSHGLMWAPILDESAKNLKKSIAFYPADGTPPFFDIPVVKNNTYLTYYSTDEKYAFDIARLKYLNIWKPKLVIICSKWSNDYEMQKVTPLIEYIGRLGSKILIIEQPPELFFGDKNAPQYLSFLGIATKGETRGYLRTANTNNYIKGINTIHNITRKYSYCKSIPIYDLFARDNKILVVDAGNVLYIDDDHLSYAGTQKAKSRILHTIKMLLN